MQTWYRHTLLASLLCAALASAGELPAPKQVPMPAQPAEPAFNEFDPGSSPFVAEPEPFVYPANRFWISGTYLHWWAKDDLFPPLITVGNAADAVPGAIGQPGTRAVFADLDDEESRAGVRINLGVALEPTSFAALEGNFLYLANRVTRFEFLPTSSLVIARPFIDLNTGAQDAFVVFSPGTVTGNVIATGDSEIWGGELNFRVRQFHRPGLVFHFLGGFRYLQLNDSLRIEETSSVGTSTPLVRADSLTRFDEFLTRNRFFGAQVGLEAEWVWHNFVCNVYGKLAVGTTQEEVSISGGTLAQNFGAAPFTPINAGLLAAPTNSGNFSQGRVGVLGEFGFNLGYQLTPNWRVGVGYSRLYWNRVARAGQQIDTTLNPTQLTDTGTPEQLVGPIRPAFNFREADFWVQGVNFTVEFRY